LSKLADSGGRCVSRAAAFASNRQSLGQDS
jgi:hypothetical protein